MIYGLVLNYNDATRTIRCVESLLADGVDRVLVWENSDDDGRAQAEIAAHFGTDSRVRIRGVGKNLGFAAGVNAGIRLCTSQFPTCSVLLLNNDAVLMPGAATALSNALAATGAAIAYPDIDNAGSITGTTYYNALTGWLGKRKLPGSFAHASGCCLLIDVQQFPEGWVFDEDFFMYGEDAELGWRLAREGKAMSHVAQTLVHHEGSASSRNGSMFYETRMALAHLILADKLARTFAGRQIYLAMRAITLAARASIRSVRQRSLRPFKGLMQGLQLYLQRRAASRRG